MVLLRGTPLSGQSSRPTRKGNISIALYWIRSNATPENCTTWQHCKDNSQWTLRFTLNTSLSVIDLFHLLNFGHATAIAATCDACVTRTDRETDGCVGGRLQVVPKRCAARGVPCNLASAAPM
ncbi:hypothetical protein J6590_053526 [Homalodisca vitripennis]|nr:hypothetical protein J6590_053526 [Homalodisca vitripennis]